MKSSDPVRYLDYYEAVVLHIMLMRRLGERNFGVADRSLIESELARPHHAAGLENADLVRQAATLCYGLIKNPLGSVGTSERQPFLLIDSFTETESSCKRPFPILYKWRLQWKQVDTASMSWMIGIAAAAFRSRVMAQRSEGPIIFR